MLASIYLSEHLKFRDYPELHLWAKKYCTHNTNRMVNPPQVFKYTNAYHKLWSTQTNIKYMYPHTQKPHAFLNIKLKKFYIFW